MGIKKTTKTATDNPLIIHSIQVWYKIRELLKIEGFLSPKTPLWGNRLLPMILQSGNFRSWQEKGISRLEHCYKDLVFLSPGQLKEKYSLTNKDFFNYLQLHDFISTNQKGDLNLPLQSNICVILANHYLEPSQGCIQLL